MNQSEHLPILDYLYLEPLVEGWIVSFYASGDGDIRNTVIVRSDSDCGQAVKKIINNLQDYLGAKNKITRICHSGGKRFSVWLESEEHINAENMSFFADYVLAIAVESEKEFKNKNTSFPA